MEFPSSTTLVLGASVVMDVSNITLPSRLMATLLYSTSRISRQSRLSATLPTHSRHLLLLLQKRKKEVVTIILSHQLLNLPSLQPLIKHKDCNLNQSKNSSKNTGATENTRIESVKSLTSTTLDSLACSNGTRKNYPITFDNTGVPSHRIGAALDVVVQTE